ncbi:C2H2 finger domain-containing protein [Zymoseptoria brevis]|uniref:C2H2 finger domain-containing protein n=1 Tax=Zymoseptoria brevis TaxID=1047168 RepID=A0A0F4GTJ8_9PEZI|nr:C2H2 finger domain-containing protein [Zymoseptoria brevis]
MVKRKHDWEPLEVRLAKTFCYYCDREFNDEKELTDHQKAKHFRCSQCNRRLNTVGGLYVHLEQVHKIKLTEVPNCTIEGRGMVVREQEIYGMVGVPEHLIKARIAEITQAFYSEEAEYRAKTGNSLDTGNVVAPEIKKQKKEQDMKKGVAGAKEEIARRKAAQAAAKAAAEAGHPPPSVSPGVPSNTEEATAAPYTPPTAMQVPVTMQHNSGQPAPFNHTSQYTPPHHMYQPAYHNGGMQAQTPNVYHNGGMQAQPPNVYHNGIQAQARPGISMYGAASPYNSSFSHQNAAAARMAHGPPHTTTLPPAQHHGLPPRPTSGYPLYPTAPTQASGASLPQKMAKLPTPVSAAPNGPQNIVSHQVPAMNGQGDTAAAAPGPQGREVAAVAEIPLAAPETAIEAPAPARAPGLVMAINDEPWEERRARAPRYLERVRQFLGF